MSEKQKPQGLNIEIAEHEAEGVYSNLVIVSHSDSEFILDFARLLPGQPKAKVHSRVIMNPANCKRFLAALTDNITRFEQQFGRIPDPGLPVIPGGPESVQ